MGVKKERVGPKTLKTHIVQSKVLRVLDIGQPSTVRGYSSLRRQHRHAVQPATRNGEAEPGNFNDESGNHTDSQEHGRGAKAGKVRDWKAANQETVAGHLRQSRDSKNIARGKCLKFEAMSQARRVASQEAPMAVGQETFRGAIVESQMGNNGNNFNRAGWVRKCQANAKKSSPEASPNKP